MKKYLPIQINQEWNLREVNAYEEERYTGGTGGGIQADNFEKEAIANAKPIINHDGREWYDSKDLEPSWQQRLLYDLCDSPEDYIWETLKEKPIIRATGFETREVWKYIGEKPVEKATGIEFESEAMDYYRSYWKSDNNSVSYEPVVEAYCFAADKERTRIIGIIEAEMELRNGTMDTPIRVLNTLFTKINNL